MVRLYRRDDAKSNPGGKDVWQRVDPREFSNPVSTGARAVAGRSYGGAPRYGVRTEHPIHNAPRGGEADEIAADELYLFIQNDGDLYRQQFEPIVKNLNRKRAKGEYDSEKAVKLWIYLVDNGARKYIKEFGTPGSHIDTVFNRATRLRVATRLRDDYEAEYGTRK